MLIAVLKPLSAGMRNRLWAGSTLEGDNMSKLFRFSFQIAVVRHLKIRVSQILIIIGV